jgi:hypothetical protein
MAMAKWMKLSGHKQLLTKPQGVLYRMPTKVRLHFTCLAIIFLIPAIYLIPAGDGSAIPFNTQFFHDDDDDGPGFDDGFDGDLVGTADPGEQDLLAETQGKTRRVRPEFVNYTKRAKRVDVRRLKENIWKGLKIPTPEEHPDDAETMVRDVRGIRV